MARLLLLADSNFANNVNAYGGRKIKNLEFVNCQNKSTVIGELHSFEEGIVVIACLDMLAAEAGKATTEGRDRAVELNLNHVLWKVMEMLEDSNGKVVCGVMAPMYWESHLEEVKRGLLHTFRLFEKSPVRNLILSDFVAGLLAGPDGIHLIPQAATKYLQSIYSFFDKINSVMNWELVEYESSSTESPTFTAGQPSANASASVSWADQLMEAGTELRMPEAEASPTRTLSMVSASMLPARVDTQSRLFRMAMGESAPPPPRAPGYNPMTQQFKVPPPAMIPMTLSQPPIPWPTMLTPELSSSLSKIESRVGRLEIKSFFDNLKMAGLQEEQDTEANRALLNRVVVSGIRIPNISRMTENEKVPVMRAKIMELVKELASGNESGEQDWEVVFVRHLNKQRRGQGATIIEAKFATEKQAFEFRKNYIAKKNSKEYEGLSISPAVRLATRVRVEIMFAICNLLSQHDKSIVRVTCVQYVPKPMIKITRKAGNDQESVRMMSFLEAVTWIKEKELEKSIDLRKAYDRAGASFRGILQQTFVIMK